MGSTPVLRNLERRIRDGRLVGALSVRAILLISFVEARVAGESGCRAPKARCVPRRLIAKTVSVRATATSIVIYAADVRVAMHDRWGRIVRSTHADVRVATCSSSSTTRTVLIVRRPTIRNVADLDG